MKNVEYISRSEEETWKIAIKVASLLQSGDVLTLEGDLGVGKTTFTKGIAKELHIQQTITSPTFTIIKEYDGKLPLYHMDAYRLENAEEDLGFDEYFYGEGVTVIEWASFIEDFLPEERLEIEIERISDTERKISFHAIGSRYEKIIEQLKEYEHK